MATRSVRASARRPVPSVPSDPPPRSDLQRALDFFDCEFNNACCVLHCVVQTLGQADDVLNSDDGARALNVAKQCSRTLDTLGERLDQISLRIAHEGIPAQFGQKASAKRGRRHG
jgi:hypothetical protein